MRAFELKIQVPNGRLHNQTILGALMFGGRGEIMQNNKNWFAQGSSDECCATIKLPSKVYVDSSRNNFWLFQYHFSSNQMVDILQNRISVLDWLKGELLVLHMGNPYRDRNNTKNETLSSDIRKPMIWNKSVCAEFWMDLDISLVVCK